MIVSQDVARKLATGQATQLRRPHTLSPLKPHHAYSVHPGHGKPAACRVTVLRADVTTCGDLSFVDARSMGYKTTGDAKAAWVRKWDAKWISRELVDLAAVFDDGTCSVVDWLLVKRFDTHWASRPVQVVVVARVVDEPRFLADQRRANAGQYTRSPTRSIDPTAEAVDEATQARFSRAAEAQAVEQRATFRTALEAERARREGIRRPLRRAA